MNSKKEIWITNSGEVLDVDEMTEDHVRNTLKMLIKQIREGKLGCLGYHQDRINMERRMEELREIHPSLTTGIREYGVDGG